MRYRNDSSLGLAIVKHVLERHDAELRISSTPGRGSVFSCHFPAERVSRASRRLSATGDTDGRSGE